HDEWRRLDRRLALAFEVDTGDKAALVREGKIEHGIRRSPRLAESPPDALVPARCTRLTEICEAQPRHIRQEHHISGDHYCCLARAVRAFQRCDVPIE